MNSSPRLRIFPWVTLFAGIVGLALQCWLFSCVDKKGLLPHNHIAETLCFILLAAVLGICLLATRYVDTTATHDRMFPASTIAIAGNIVGALAIAASALLSKDKDIIPRLLSVFTLIISGTLLYAAYRRFKGQHPSPMVHYIGMAFMVLRVMLSCRGWSSETQVQQFIFELFAVMFFLLALYYRAQLDVACTGHKQYLFFSQAALYCFCLSLASADFLFSLGAGMWLATESFSLPAVPQGE